MGIEMKFNAFLFNDTNNGYTMRVVIELLDSVTNPNTFNLTDSKISF